jgi:hypothetical protein
MALPPGRPPRFHERAERPHCAGGASMKRTIPILLAILAAFTLTGLFVVLARTGPLPKIGERDWRKTVKEAITDHAEPITEELPA